MVTNPDVMLNPWHPDMLAQTMIIWIRISDQWWRNELKTNAPGGDKTIVKEKELNSQRGEEVSIEKNNKVGKQVSGNWLSIPENVEL